MPEKCMAAIAIAFAIGILATDLISFTGCLLVVLSLTILAYLFVPMRSRAPLVLLAAVLLSGAARYAADRSIAANDISRFAEHVGAFEGTVASDVASGTDSIKFTFQVSRAKLTDGWQAAGGDVMVNLYADDAGKLTRLDYGDRARILVRPYLPSEPTNPGQFSYKGYLARHNIYACASVRKPWQVVVLRKSRSRSASGVAFAAKRYLVSSIYRIHPEKEASVMSGVVLGTYAYLDEQTLSDFTRTGTLHVLAASGYNCFVLVMIATPILMLLRVPRKLRSIVTIALIVFYLLMVGPVPSLVRAAVMSALLLLAVPLRRIADYVNLFYVAAVAVLLLNPSNLFDVGFQLSFLAVWALIYVIPVIQAVVARTRAQNPDAKTGWNRRRGWSASLARKGYVWVSSTIASTSIATIAVGLVTGPVVAYYFHYVSLTSLPANLAVAIVVPTVFMDCLISPLTSLLPYASHWAGFVGTTATRAMLCAVNYFGSMRYGSIAVSSPGILAIAGYYILLYACSGYVRSKLVQR